MNTWTGPQSALLEPEAPPVDDARLAGHARASWFTRLLHRGTAEPKPVSRLLAPEGGDEPGEFTQAISSYQPPPLPFRTPVLDRPQPEVAHEHYDPERTQAVSPVDLADDLPADEPPSVRPYAPPEAHAVPWGAWDDAANREPMQPSFINHVAAELTELPGFRETLAARTRNRASQCLCGDEMPGETWGERMVREGVHMLTAWDLSVVRLLTALQAPAEADRRAAA